MNLRILLLLVRQKALILELIALILILMFTLLDKHLLVFHDRCLDRTTKGREDLI